MGSVTALMMDVITEKSGHTMTGLAVSVCLTPAAPSPLPLPYPTIATVSEGVIDECLRTKIDGAKVLTVGSCTKNCHGNEPGTLKEVVSLNTAGPSFPILGAPIVFIELGMAGITLSPGFMNKNPLPGIGGSASGAGGGGGGGGGAGGGAGGPPGAGTQGPSNGGGGGGGSNSGAAPPAPPGAPGADGQAKAGHPVDVITGTMYTTPAVDAELLGPLPMQWVRQYRSSSVRRTFGIGWGWAHAFVWAAEVTPAGIEVTDSEGSILRFPHLQDAEAADAPFGRRLLRRGDDLVLVTRDGLERVLRPVGRGRHRLAELRDRSGNLTEIVWDGDDLTGVIDCVGRRLEREVSGRTSVWKLVVTDAAGQDISRFAFSYELDDRGDLARVTDAGGVTTEYAYDEEHYLLEERLPDGLVYHFRYETQADGVRRCVETWGDVPGRDIVAELAGDGRGGRGILHMKLEYGPRPFETRVTDAVGAVHRYRGNALGMVEHYVDPLGRETRLGYDAGGNLVTTSHSSGATDRLVADAMGRPLLASDANGRSVRMKRDENGDVTSLSDPGGAVWNMEYDRAGRMVRRTDPSGAVTTCEYLPSGRAVKISGPGGTEELARDAHGNLSERTDVRGAKWKFTWDLLGLPVEMSTPTGEE